MKFFLFFVLGLVTESCWGKTIVSGREVLKHDKRQDLNLQRKKTELENKGFDVRSIPGRAVKFFPTKKNWDTAKSACHDLGGYLLTIDSALVTEWARTWEGVSWIGLNDKATNGKMVWDSGLPFMYKNWHGGSTFDDAGSEDCVGVNILQIQREGGLWNDYPCDWKHSYMCEVWLNREFELRKQGFDVDTIPGRAVKYYPTKKNWDTAKSACHALGGYLLTVDSSTVTNWVKQNPAVFWIGLNDKATNGRMVWDSQRLYSYKNWHSGDTFDDSGNEDCVGVNIKMGLWNDYPCSWSLPYACEIWLSKA